MTPQVALCCRLVSCCVLLLPVPVHVCLCPAAEWRLSLALPCLFASAPDQLSPNQAAEGRSQSQSSLQAHTRSGARTAHTCPKQMQVTTRGHFHAHATLQSQRRVWHCNGSSSGQLQPPFAVALSPQQQLTHRLSAQAKPLTLSASSAAAPPRDLAPAIAVQPRPLQPQPQLTHRIAGCAHSSTTQHLWRDDMEAKQATDACRRSESAESSGLSDWRSLASASESAAEAVDVSRSCRSSVESWPHPPPILRSSLQAAIPQMPSPRVRRARLRSASSAEQRAAASASVSAASQLQQIDWSEQHQPLTSEHKQSMSSQDAPHSTLDLHTLSSLTSGYESFPFPSRSPNAESAVTI